MRTIWIALLAACPLMAAPAPFLRAPARSGGALHRLPQEAAVQERIMSLPEEMGQLMFGLGVNSDAGFTGAVQFHPTAPMPLPNER